VRQVEICKMRPDPRPPPDAPLMPLKTSAPTHIRCLADAFFISSPKPP
jgi:hypothetical protein